jgi:hypothetical protein
MRVDNASAAGRGSDVWGRQGQAWHARISSQPYALQLVCSKRVISRQQHSTEEQNTIAHSAIVESAHANHTLAKRASPP